LAVFVLRNLRNLRILFPNPAQAAIAAD
jgi:hypothetical protein